MIVKGHSASLLMIRFDELLHVTIIFMSYGVMFTR